MTTVNDRYVPPPPAVEPKPRYVVVTDELEILAIARGSLKDPIGQCVNGTWYATENSLRQFRGLPVEFTV